MTARVVLKRERVIVIPDAVVPGQAIDGAKLAEALGLPKSTKLVVRDDVWSVVGAFGGSKQQAIEAYAGKPNTPDAKPGVYKAPSVSAMRGGREYERPPQPKVEAKDID